MKRLTALSAGALLSALVIGSLSLARSGAGPAAAAPQKESEIPSACGAVVTETVSAAAFRQCETTDVTVTAAVTCPAGLPLHVVFVVAKHLLMEDHLPEVKRAAASAANALEFKHGAMAGLVTLSAQERREVELTDDKGAVVSAINRIRLDRIDPTIRESDWLGEAQRMLDQAHQDYPAKSPIDVIVLYSTGCPTGFESYCQRQVGSASKAKNKGTTLIGVCNPDARPFGFRLPGNHCRWIKQMSSGGFYHDLQQAGRVERDFVDLQEVGEKLTIADAALVEQLGPGLEFVTGLADPRPVEADGELTWTWTDVAPGSLLTATYRITPTTAGVLDLRTQDSQLVLADSLGRLSAPVPVPGRALTVTTCLPQAPTPTVTQAATHTPPTATETPTSTPAPSYTPTATATPVPAVVYMPVALRRVCHDELHADVVLAIDSSSSMLAESGGRSKLDQAKDAARRFVRLLDLRADQAAVVSFSIAATLEAPLTTDAGLLQAAIDRITAREGTHIHLALERATTELQSTRARPGNNPVIVLLTDGRPASGTAGAARAAAARAKELGIVIYTIGLGDDVDAALLRQLATSPDHFVAAPDAVDLERIYERIAGELPCPGGVAWPIAGR